MKKKHLIALGLLALLSAPVYAVFNEKDLGQTLSVLRYELHSEYSKMANSREKLDNRNGSRHFQMIGMMKKCNELSLMLYSQKQDFTFDMTYALKSVTSEYEAFNENKLPFDNIISRLDLEIDRYSRLVESLRRLPPQLRDIKDLPDSLKYHNDSVNFNFSNRQIRVELDSAKLAEMRAARARMRAAMEAGNAEGAVPSGMPNLDEAEGPNALFEKLQLFKDDSEKPFFLDKEGQADRDSCLFYATELLKMYSDSKDKFIKDSEHYDDASARLKESYDYAQNRYKVLQKRIFIDGQDNYLAILTHPVSYWKKAWQDCVDKYSTSVSVDGDGTPHSEWKGGMVLGLIGIVLVYLLISVLIASLITKIVNKYVRRLGDKRFGVHERCLICFFGCVIFALSLMVLVQIVKHNFMIVACKLLLVLAWLLAAIILSMYIRLNNEQIGAGMRLYLPLVVAGILVITFRIIFIPNSMLNIIFPPILLLCFIWQLRACIKRQNQVEQSDRIIGWVTLAVFGISTIASMVGYVFIGILLIIWWLFQVASLESVFAIFQVLRHYERILLEKKLTSYKASGLLTPEKVRKGEFIGDTWFFDLIKYAGVPVFTILSFPFCLRMAADVFDFTSTYSEYVNKPLFALYDANANPILHISLHKIILVAALFFVFKYINYVARAIYKKARISSEKKKNGGAYIHTNQINFTLANNVISIVVWGIFIVMVVLLCKIPVGAISVIFAGLATGLGLAMKDILNNFIYGIQLMSGRLRVGDWVECDGVRGKVTEISYQSTQIETVDGAVMSFLNTALFNKNFKNLTRNNSYEFVKIPVGVAYGADVDKVRQVILEAVKEVAGKDKYGRPIVDPGRGVSVFFDEFSESSVDVAVRQFVLVSERTAYIARAKEAIYNALNENGIEIPFPQRDVHIK